MSDRSNRLYPTMREDGTQIMVRNEPIRGRPDREGVVPQTRLPELAGRLQSLGMFREEVSEVFNELLQENRETFDAWMAAERVPPRDFRYRTPPAGRE